MYAPQPLCGRTDLIKYQVVQLYKRLGLDGLNIQVFPLHFNCPPNPFPRVTLLSQEPAVTLQRGPS